MSDEVSVTNPKTRLDVDSVSRLEALETSLRQREEELAEAYEIAQLGVWHWDVATDTVTWSEQVYRIFGLEPKVTAPDFAALRTLHAPESRKELESLVERALTTGEPYEHDMQLVLADGTRRWVIARGHVAARDMSGRVVELRGTVQDITERKLAEEATSRSEARYRSLVRASSDIVWISSIDGTQAGDIPDWRAFTGQSAEEVRGFGWADAIHPDDLQATLKAWDESIRTGKSLHVRHRLRRHDGVYRMMEARAVASRDATGEITEWVGTHVDITQQVEAEAAVYESQERFRMLYSSDLIGIGFPDAEGGISDGNDALLRIVGYTREDMNAGLVRWDTMTPPEYRELDLEHIREAHATGSCTPYEKEYIRKDGTRVPILCGFALMDGPKRQSIGFVLDLSVQKRAEKVAREREMQFRELAESLPQLVWASDVNGDRVYTNKRYADYTGVPDAKLLGKMWRELLHPDDLERTNRLWAHSMRTGEPYLNEYRIRRHDGIYRSFLVRAVAVRNGEGEIERWLGSATDIHDQKLAEEALRRTEKLAAAGRLAATIAHEINNPLAAVTNSLFLALMDETLNETTRSYLNMAEQELARAAHVTTQTLQFHRQNSAAAVADLGAVMDSAVALFSTRFKTCEIAVEREYSEPRELYCSADELRQVFANLLSNSLDAMRRGGRLRVRIRGAHGWGENPSPGVRVTIGDTGSGIPAEVMARVFEPFLSTKEATGTGLGLWVSQNIVLKHHGRIQLRSKVQGDRRGTVFSLFFPADGTPE